MAATRFGLVGLGVAIHLADTFFAELRCRIFFAGAFFCFLGRFGFGLLLFFVLLMFARLQHARQNLQQPPKRFSAMAVPIFLVARKFSERFIQRWKEKHSVVSKTTRP